mmetsp:Transcript_28346/g.45601  ORF Transcript_28346/g.45601 Transcript_28346/m.45601 type:complete len:86 (+) Transcript_28346:1692-1949(+)
MAPHHHLLIMFSTIVSIEDLHTAMGRRLPVTLATESEEAPLPMMKDDGIEKEDEEADQCQEDVTILDRRHHITGEMVEVEEAKTR